MARGRRDDDDDEEFSLLTEPSIPKPPWSRMALPHLGSGRIGRSHVPTMGGGFLIDLIDGEILWSPEVRSLNFLDEFVSDGAQRMSAFGDFYEMDVGIEIVERREVRLAGVVWWIHAQEVNRVGPLRRRCGLGDLAIQNGPHLSKSRELVFVRVLIVDLRHYIRAQCLGRMKSTGSNRQQFVSRFATWKRGSGALKRLGRIRRRSRAGAWVPPFPGHEV
jgi:hypothetical protein